MLQEALQLSENTHSWGPELLWEWSDYPARETIWRGQESQGGGERPSGEQSSSSLAQAP